MQKGKEMVRFLLSVFLVLAVTACAKAGTETERGPGQAESTEIPSTDNPAAVVKEDEMCTFTITVGDTSMTAELADNSSAQAFAELLKEGDVIVDMHDYGDFEKVGPLGTSLPKNDTQITTEAGDVILYQGSQITIYYDVNSWNFTRLGKIKDITQQELKDILGDGDVTVTFSAGE